MCRKQPGGGPRVGTGKTPTTSFPVVLQCSCRACAPQRRLEMRWRSQKALSAASGGFQSSNTEVSMVLSHLSFSVGPWVYIS